MRCLALTILGSLIAAGCQENGGVARDDRARPATQPAQQQSAVTDERTIRRTRLAVARGGPAAGQRQRRLEPYVLFYGPMPTVFTFSRDDRLFAAFPRWGDPVNYTVAEIKKDGRVVPFPDAQTNAFYPSHPDKLDPATHLVSVQSVVIDSQNRLWLLDTGSINFNPVIPGAAKMWAYDLRSGKRVKDIRFGDAVKNNTYLNDVRFDLPRGKEGFAYITDSGAGGIIVVDLASGQAWRRLDGHPSVRANTQITLMVEGEALQRRPPGSDQPEPLLIHSDGIALSPDGRTLYYTPLTAREIYSVSTDALVDRNLPDDRVTQTVRTVARKPSANDGIVCDSDGRIYTTDFEDNAVRRFDRNGEAELLVQDERLLWPDCVWIHDGHVYVNSNQLHRQPQFHSGQDLRQQPYVLFRYPVSARAAR